MQQLVDYIAKRGGEVTARVLVRNLHRFRVTDDATTALDELVRAGRGAWVNPAPRFSADDYLVWVERRDLEQLVRQPVQRILSNRRAQPCQFAVDKVRRVGESSQLMLVD